MFDDSLGFNTYNDFFKRRQNIKKKFKLMGDKERKIYRMYLYAQRDFSTNQVDLIWEYLNEPDSSIFCPTTEQLKQYFNHKLEEIELSRLEGDDFEY